MIKVYHNADFLDVAFMFDNKGWASKAQLTHVANVDIPDEECGDAFRLTNHIDSAWQDNPEVESLTDKPRSTSVGDVIELSDGRMMICRSIGWDEYPEAEKKQAGLSEARAYCAVDKNGRSMITVLAHSTGEATAQIKEQLNRNPSRTPYYDKWMRAGCLVRKKDWGTRHYE